ncbi:helix-turn-helix transcriptional regulator [Asticcacaulis machinosus]|uniref:helix-turn-helix transcriptional regulator n=1 Tax=Asticcacaulis machinosus TaxID=2984211 RepID=UPI003F6001D4
MQPTAIDVHERKISSTSVSGSALDHDQLWSLSKVCDVLGGVSDDTFHRLVKRKEFRRIKQGRCTYVLAREVRAYIDRLSQSAT